MENNTAAACGLSGNQLKLIALLAMTCDHVGLSLLPQYGWMRIVGRLALPIFAYMIAEGCRYTKNRKRYLGGILGMGLLCQLVYWFALQSLEQSILTTFALSIILIYALDAALTRPSAKRYVIAVVCLAAIGFICLGLPRLLPNTGFRVDYGFYGVLLPVPVYLGRTKQQKLLLLAVGLIAMAIHTHDIQWYALCALPLLALYSGQRGKWNIKTLFYVYFPLHLAAIWLIDEFIAYYHR